MDNDRNTARDADMTDESMRDRTQTIQRSRTERGEIDNSSPEIQDDDEIINEASRSDIGAGE